MQDRYGRTIDSLRISLNRTCNLRCLYCHNEGQYEGASSMTPDEIARLVKVASDLGIDHVKLTGGEPLLRDDVVDIIGRVSPLVKEVSLTTNGALLQPLAKDLRAAGLARVNISLDSVDPSTYKRICRSGRLDDVLAGIDAAFDADLRPVKLNMVLLRGYNVSELPDMLMFAARKGAVLQVIEYEVDREEMDGRLFRDHHVALTGLETALEATAERIGENPLHHRKRYRTERLVGTEQWPGTDLGRPVEVEIVRPMHNKEFCANCKRIRITSSGRLKGCLFQEEGTVDALGPLRAGADDERLRELFLRIVEHRRPYWADPETQPMSEEHTGPRTGQDNWCPKEG